MKTLVIINFDKAEMPNFTKKFEAELGSNNVISIQHPENLEDLKKKLNDHQGQFDRVVVATYGSNQKEIPTMDIAGDSRPTITEVIKILNEDNKATLKKIHLTSCFIGTNFDKIAQSDTSSTYSQELEQYLQKGQVLFLHGDDQTGNVLYSLDKRLAAIIADENYSPSEAVFDSGESMSVVVKQSNNSEGGASLQSFSYQPFGRQNKQLYKQFTNDAITEYLSDVVKKAREFETNQGILNGDASETKLLNLREKDCDEYFSKTISRELSKTLDSGDLEMFKSLIENIGPNYLDKIDEDRWTPLMYAAYRGKPKVAKFLTEEAGIDLNLQNKYGATALIISADEGRTEILEALLKAGANVDLQNKDGWTALMYTAEKGRTDMVQDLVGAEADVNLKNKYGVTALMIATEKGHTDIVQALIKAGANVDIKENNGWTALMYASEKGQKDTVEALLEAGADVNIKENNGWTSLMFAIATGETEVAKFLIEKELTNLNLTNKDGTTALMFAASKNNNTKTLEALLEAGADVNLKDNDGWTALMYATKKGHDDIVQALVKAGADVNRPNKDDVTALMIAVNQNHIETVEALIKAGADVNRQNKDGWTPLMFATREGHADMVEYLLTKTRINLDVQDKDSFTALMLASREGNVPVVKALLNSEADVNLQNKAGHTAYDLASIKGHEAVKTLLEEAKAKSVSNIATDVQVDVQGETGTTCSLSPEEFKRKDGATYTPAYNRVANSELANTQGNQASDSNPPILLGAKNTRFPIITNSMTTASGLFDSTRSGKGSQTPNSDHTRLRGAIPSNVITTDQTVVLIGFVGAFIGKFISNKLLRPNKEKSPNTTITPIDGARVKEIGNGQKKTK